MNQPEKINPQKRQPRWYFLLSIILAAFFLVLALQGVSWEEILGTLLGMRLEYLVLIFLINSVAIFLRGIRWGVLLSAERKISLFTMFWATAAGYLGNTFLPARAGEVIRSMALGRKANISMSYVLATALTERVMDLLILVLVSSLSLSTIGELPSWLPGSMRFMTFFGLVAFILFLFAPKFDPFFRKILGSMPVPKNWSTRLYGLLDQFLRGTQAFLHPLRAGRFLTLSAVIWLLDGINAMLTASSFNLSLSLPQAMLFLSGLGLSSAIPSTPGYVGIYQFVATTILPAYNFTRSQAITFVLACQVVNVLAITLWGLIGLWRLKGNSLIGTTGPD